ncbi:DedA family protein [Planctomonas psychrotolerans]|uniref:DedA family protein n=1 Tax=Planctomonas psychrotolerans TaxID=2528712 RepID=UPI003873A2C5
MAGLAVDVIDALGAPGVGAMTLLETVFPPIPSEVVLPLAGFVVQQGDMNLVAVLAAATLGGLLGAYLLYYLGYALGEERVIRWLSHLPLVDREDFERSAHWFHRHGRSAVFFGRLIPGVRSLISLPAGSARMGIGAFTVFTALGSLVWNSLLVSLGMLLGTQYRLIDRYSVVLDYAVYAVLTGVVVWLIVRRVRRRSAAG